MYRVEKLRVLGFRVQGRRVQGFWGLGFRARVAGMFGALFTGSAPLRFL